jgi:hypothetical protein
MELCRCHQPSPIINMNKSFHFYAPTSFKHVRNNYGDSVRAAAYVLASPGALWVVRRCCKVFVALNQILCNLDRSGGKHSLYSYAVKSGAVIASRNFTWPQEKNKQCSWGSTSPLWGTLALFLEFFDVRMANFCPSRLPQKRVLWSFLRHGVFLRKIQTGLADTHCTAWPCILPSPSVTSASVGDGVGVQWYIHLFSRAH